MRALRSGGAKKPAAPATTTTTTRRKSAPAAAVAWNADQTCIICQETPLVEPTVLCDGRGHAVCTHQFCSPCLQSWARLRTQCPACRRDFAGIRIQGGPGLQRVPRAHYAFWEDDEDAVTDDTDDDDDDSDSDSDSDSDDKRFDPNDSDDDVSRGWRLNQNGEKQWTEDGFRTHLMKKMRQQRGYLMDEFTVPDGYVSFEDSDDDDEDDDDDDREDWDTDSDDEDEEEGPWVDAFPDELDDDTDDEEDTDDDDSDDDEVAKVAV